MTENCCSIAATLPCGTSSAQRFVTLPVTAMPNFEPDCAPAPFRHVRAHDVDAARASTIDLFGDALLLTTL